jgi:long-subunit acyl-CoA synthetase (AMP-forming)
LNTASSYYRTGDLVAEVGPGRLVYLDRRNNDFVPVSRRHQYL